jgi:hypothetical protein
MTTQNKAAAKAGNATPDKPEKAAKPAKAAAKRPSRAKAKKDPTVARGPGRPPKPKKPQHEYVVTYLASTSGGALPKSRRVLAVDPGDAIVQAHALNKIIASHQYNVKVNPVDGPAPVLDAPLVDENGLTVAAEAENADEFDDLGDL